MSRRPELFRPLLASSSCLLLVCFSGACDRSSESPLPDVSAGPISISGRYDLSGVTTTPGSDQARKIRGIMLIEREGDHYKASYEFETNLPGEGPPVNAQVIGVGEGEIDGHRLVGTARTQIVVSAVPGVDAGFAFIPRTVSTRIVSSSIGELGPDGSLEIEIESRAAEGEEYAATKTRMSGRRIADLGSSSAADDVGGNGN